MPNLTGGMHAITLRHNGWCATGSQHTNFCNLTASIFVIWHFVSGSMSYEQDQITGDQTLLHYSVTHHSPKVMDKVILSDRKVTRHGCAKVWPSPNNTSTNPHPKHFPIVSDPLFPQLPSFKKGSTFRSESDHLCPSLSDQKVLSIFRKVITFRKVLLAKIWIFFCFVTFRKVITFWSKCSAWNQKIVMGLFIYEYRGQVKEGFNTSWHYMRPKK